MTNKLIESLRDKDIKSLIELEYYPITKDEDSRVITQSKIPFSEISTLGIAFEPFSEIFQKVSNKGNAGSGIYRVTVPEGRTLADLAKFQDGRGNLGSVLIDGKVGGGQAVLNPIAFNPTMLFLAAALTSIEQKLDRIEEIQEEILNFLIQKERSQLKGDLNFLIDVLKNYKYNWDNDKYKNNNHINVLSIKKDSERKIDFYKEKIKSKINRSGLIKNNKIVEKEMKTIENEFKDYQLSMYLFAFSSFLEIILLENYNSEYLESIVRKIDGYSFEYRELYSKAYTTIERSSEGSIENRLLRLGSNFSTMTGKGINKVPIIKKSNLEENLKKLGNNLDTKRTSKTEKVTELFIERHNSHVSPFIEKINYLDCLYNKPVQIFFDEGNIYLGQAD